MFGKFKLCGEWFAPGDVTETKQVVFQLIGVQTFGKQGFNNRIQHFRQLAFLVVNRIAQIFNQRLAVNCVKIKSNGGNRATRVVEKDFGVGVQVRMELFCASRLRREFGAPLVIQPPFTLAFRAKNFWPAGAVRDGIGDPTRIELVADKRLEPFPQLFDA